MAIRTWSPFRFNVCRDLPHINQANKINEVRRWVIGYFFNFFPKADAILLLKFLNNLNFV